MAGTLTQENRLLSIETPLGEDILLIKSFTGSESISNLFDFDLELVAEVADAPSIAADALIGKKVTIHVALTDDYSDSPRRYFNGLVSRFSQGQRSERFVFYQAEVVPWLWLLTLTSDCRIFQNMNVPEIVKQVFDDLKKEYPDIVSYRDDTSSDKYVKLDYCVQYRETDFNFVARLMEQEGIFYFFEHEQDAHTLVMADSSTAHQPCPGQSRVRYQPEGGRGEWENTVTAWQVEQELRPGKYALRDYHFQMPSKSLEVAELTTVDVGSSGKLEMYDYPGEYAQRFKEPEQRLEKVEPEGRKLVKLRMEEEEAPYLEVNGTSYCRAFNSGYRFELTRHYDHNLEGSYVLTSLQHSAVQDPDYFSEGGSEGVEEPYHNSFACIPEQVPFRPPRLTPKPVVQGPQTAVVVGKQGEEIWTDKYGRVKVQFHWDREGRWDENSSCWVRVAQNWAGKRWGATFLPRIGQEVVVVFLEGDPDAPLIVGSVYNAEEMPPYLGNGPDDKHPHDPELTGIKTNTTKGGQGFNELRFDDTKGKEQVFIHAERNMDARVKNDSYEWIGNDQHLIVKNDQKELIEANSHIHVQGDRMEQVDGSQSLNVGMNQDEKVGMKHALDAGQEIHLKAGMKVIVEAGIQLTIKASGGFIDIGPAGITIQGTMVRINSGGAPGVGSGSSPTAPEDAEEADNAVTGSKSAPN